MQDRTSAVATALADLAGPLEATTTVGEDRILRAFAPFVSATLRIRRFQRRTDGAPSRQATGVVSCGHQGRLQS
ncbi:hypothetical protein H7J73_19250 [Mycolicibacterium komossense]|uniref:Uncharacterized protein n=1 Tax=Mycolicibacterium komossense TaxID=1779 RepID=A0ABT3CF73_9MYCO|nr:hypothetical protein [Mycolicibacterium komossense]